MASLPKGMTLAGTRNVPGGVRAENRSPALSRLTDAMRSGVVLELTLDTGPFIAALAKFAAEMTDTARADARWHEVRVSGREAAMYVRGGLDPAYSSEEALRGLVVAIMRGESDPLDALLTREHRARLAASALRGWVEHRAFHPDGETCRGDGEANCWCDQQPPIWHRYLAGTTVLVSA